MLFGTRILFMIEDRCHLLSFANPSGSLLGDLETSSMSTPWPYRAGIIGCSKMWDGWWCWPSNLKWSTGISHTRYYQIIYQYVYQLLYLSIPTCSNYSLDQIRWQKYTNSSSGICHRNRWHPGRIVAGLWHQRLFWRWQGKYPMGQTLPAIIGVNGYITNQILDDVTNHNQTGMPNGWRHRLQLKEACVFEGG